MFGVVSVVWCCMFNTVVELLHISVSHEVLYKHLHYTNRVHKHLHTQRAVRTNPVWVIKASGRIDKLWKLSAVYVELILC
jgi:hypothetical protein